MFVRSRTLIAEPRHHQSEDDQSSEVGRAQHPTILRWSGKMDPTERIGEGNRMLLIAPVPGIGVAVENDDGRGHMITA